MNHLRQAWAQRIAATDTITLYRGMQIVVPEGTDYLDACKDPNGRWELGIHWTPKLSVAQGFARPREPEFYPPTFDNGWVDTYYKGPHGMSTSLLLEAEVPVGSHSDYWSISGVQVPVEEEVTLAPGTSIVLKAISHFEGGRWHRQSLNLRTTAGPGEGVIPERVKYRGPLNIHEPRRVVIDPMAQRDMRRLEPHEQNGAREIIKLLERGGANLEPKQRELEGTYGVKIDADCRLLVYPHTDGAWHIYYMGDHDYEEAQRRMSAPRVASILERGVR